MSKGMAWYGERRSANIPIGTNNLIICCGAETEKNYFEGVANFLTEQEQNRLLRFFIEVDAVDPMNMAKRVRLKTDSIEKNKGCKIHNVWVLFDKDDFPDENFNNAINKIHSLSTKSVTFYALWSNECFELWLLLNFINMHSAISREEYIVKLEKYLQEKYRKNDKNIFGKIMLKNGSIEKAISYAKSLIDIEKKLLLIIILRQMFIDFLSIIQSICGYGLKFNFYC